MVLVVRVRRVLPMGVWGGATFKGANAGRCAVAVGAAIEGIIPFMLMNGDLRAAVQNARRVLGLLRGYGGAVSSVGIVLASRMRKGRGTHHANHQERKGKGCKYSCCFFHFVTSLIFLNCFMPL